MFVSVTLLHNPINAGLSIESVYFCFSESRFSRLPSWRPNCGWMEHEIGIFLFHFFGHCCWKHFHSLFTRSRVRVHIYEPHDCYLHWTLWHVFMGVLEPLCAPNKRTESQFFCRSPFFFLDSGLVLVKHEHNTNKSHHNKPKTEDDVTRCY